MTKEINMYLTEEGLTIPCKWITKETDKLLAHLCFDYDIQIDVYPTAYNLYGVGTNLLMLLQELTANGYTVILK